MHRQLLHDLQQQDALLEAARTAASSFLADLATRPPAVAPRPHPLPELPAVAPGAQAALAAFRAQFEAGLAGSAGPRYFGFVTGGATPAALIGDWLASAYDQNPAADHDSSAPAVEAAAIHLLRQLFGLPRTFFGTFVSGATIANMAGLAQGRQWVGRQHGVDVAEVGLHAVPPVRVFGGTLHSSTYKSLAMLGLGRQSVTAVATLPDREAVDVAALERALAATDAPCIVVASGGTVNTVDFDDLAAIAALRARYPFWLHVDAAFGGFAACSPRFAPLLAGLDQADSITIDAHKWLNVPYDSAMIFSRHPRLQRDVFQNAAAYLGDIGDSPAPVHLAPQNSRRFRALPAWMTLMAYGRDGYREMVERTVDLARALGERLAATPHFRLLAPTRLNVVCFTTAVPLTLPQINAFLDRVRDDGRVFLTPTVYNATPGMRAALSNWQTTAVDVDICCAALTAVLEAFLAEQP